MFAETAQPSMSTTAAQNQRNLRQNAKTKKGRLTQTRHKATPDDVRDEANRYTRAAVVTQTYVKQKQETTTTSRHNVRNCRCCAISVKAGNYGSSGVPSS